MIERRSPDNVIQAAARFRQRADLDNGMAMLLREVAAYHDRAKKEPAPRASDAFEGIADGHFLEFPRTERAWQQYFNAPEKRFAFVRPSELIAALGQECPEPTATTQQVILRLLRTHPTSDRALQVYELPLSTIVSEELVTPKTGAHPRLSPELSLDAFWRVPGTPYSIAEAIDELDQALRSRTSGREVVQFLQKAHNTEGVLRYTTVLLQEVPGSTSQ